MKLLSKIFDFKSMQRSWILIGGMLATFLAFVVCWCMQTTFRAMSDWVLYAVNIFAALLFSLPALLCRRVWVQILVMVLLDCLFISNLMYCRTYFTAIPPESYLLAGNLMDFTASVRDSLRWADIIFPLVTLATAALSYLSPAGGWMRRRDFSLLTLAFALISLVGMLIKGGFYKDYDRMAQSCYYSTCGVPTYTIGGHIAYSLMSEPDEQSTAANRQEIAEWQGEKDRLLPYRPLGDSITPRRNLVIILLESFESWPLEKQADGKEITPYLNSLLRDRNTFYAPNVLTQVASGRSIDAQLLIGSGMLPMLGSVYSMKYPDRDYPSLMKAMKEDRRSHNIILTCDKPITWNQEVIARSMGYDSLLHRSSWRTDELVGNPAKLSDGSFMRQSVEKLKKNQLGLRPGEPYLLTFVTYSGHNPFVLPDKLKDPAFMLKKGEYPDRMADYMTMAHYTDASIRNLVDYLKSRPDYAETLIVITGDHEGLAGDRAEILKSGKGKELVSPRQLTPLIVLNSPVAGRIDRVVGQVDIYPTLLNLLGLDNYAWKGVGTSILDGRHPGVAISSMTGEIAGDTTKVSPQMMDLLKKARRVSDMKIRLKN